MKKRLIEIKKENIEKFSTDQKLWSHVVSSVKPLRSHFKNTESKKVAWPISHNTFLKKVQRNKIVNTNTRDSVQSSSLPELTHDTHFGIDKSSAKKLKKGQHTIESQLDLHGMTQKQACVSINSFIQNSFHSGKRCVLIITGKGNKPDGSVGLLRMMVPRWLNEEPNRSCVLAFSYAVPKDGGEGALYVMLKRKR